MELTIEKLVYGGSGLGRLPEGEVLFVPWSVPGDHLTIERQLGSVKPPQGRIIDIKQAGLDRVTPQCSVFGKCGGCHWQQLTPSTQREWKRKIVEESLIRIGKLNALTVQETLGSDETAWTYRNRAQWEIEPAAIAEPPLQESDSGSPVRLVPSGHLLGYHASQSHDVIEFDTCHIIPESLNQLALWVRRFIKENPGIASGLLRMEASINQTGQILLVCEGEKTSELLDRFVSSVHQAFPMIVGITHRDSSHKQAPPVLLWGQSFLTEILLNQTFQVSADSFFQTNADGSRHLLSVLDREMMAEPESLLDLFAGVGVFAIHFKDRAKRILAIESAASAVADAKENLVSNQAEHIEIRQGDARGVLGQLKEKFDVAIIDPPRAGCQPEVLYWLARNIQKQLLYVSCNPTTLARDLKSLTAQGWNVETVQPIDMFPQTYHIETVVSLTRRTSV